MKKDLKLGTGYTGVLHYDKEKPISLEDWFKEISQSKIFDYVDKTPPKDQFVNLYYSSKILYEDNLKLIEELDMKLDKLAKIAKIGLDTTGL